MEVELAEFFGATVVIQLREAVLLVKPGKAQPYVLISETGDPKIVMQKNNELHPAAREQIVPDVPAAPEYTLVITGRLLPGKSGRIYIIYETEGHVAKMSIRPSDILAVTWIEQKLEPSRVISAS